MVSLMRYGPLWPSSLRGRSRTPVLDIPWTFLADFWPEYPNLRRPKRHRRPKARSDPCSERTGPVSIRMPFSENSSSEAGSDRSILILFMVLVIVALPSGMR
jgi:hypothetical protein